MKLVIRVRKNELRVRKFIINSNHNLILFFVIIDRQHCGILWKCYQMDMAVSKSVPRH